MDSPPIAKKPRKDEAVAEYKELTRAAKEVSLADDPRQALEVVSRGMRRANALYPVVKKKLDGTAADAKYSKTISTLGKETANHLNITQRPIDLGKLLSSLKREMKAIDKDFIDHCYDNLCGCLREAPSFEFTYGSIKEEALEVRERKPHVPRIKESDTQATTAKERDIDVDVEQDQTPKEVEQLHRNIRRSASTKKEVPFFKAVLDETSFTKTVENIFHASFLVKESKIGIRSDEKLKMPVITLDDDNQTQQQQKQQQEEQGHQSILSFNLQDWRRWVEKYGGTGDE